MGDLGDSGEPAALSFGAFLVPDKRNSEEEHADASARIEPLVAAAAGSSFPPSSRSILSFSAA